jgi:hypothetical protein
VSRSGRPNADRICLAAGRKVPAGRFDASTPLLVDLQNRGNKARMSMKTKDKYKKSPSLVAPTTGSAVCGFSMVAGYGRGPQTRRSALQNRRNKARMYVKTKDKYKKSESPAVCGFPMVAKCDRGPQTRRSALRPLDRKIAGTKPECI